MFRPHEKSKTKLVLIQIPHLSLESENETIQSLVANLNIQVLKHADLNAHYPQLTTFLIPFPLLPVNDGHLSHDRNTLKEEILAGC